jgi:hypothetical protein
MCSWGQAFFVGAQFIFGKYKLEYSFYAINFSSLKQGHLQNDEQCTSE